ncbi:MAG: PEP-CTERM sorting domain-containing protein [Phycisphaerae bacterium]|nr:PEP-CTERM sorting domain-containing protein [Phycisphaerae bacterium]
MAVMWVLGIGSLASAGLILNPNGVVSSCDQITVESTGAITGFEFSISVVGGTISGTPAYPETWMFAPYVKSRSDTHIEVTGGDFFPKHGPLTVLKGLTFTRTAVEAIVTLMATGSNRVDGIIVPAGTIMDTMWVGVPEPMSLMLLGLGGLMVRRRK